MKQTIYTTSVIKNTAGMIVNISLFLIAIFQNSQQW